MGEKFEWRDVHPQPCTQEELLSHLAAFVDAFVETRAKARWRLNLVEKPERSAAEFQGWIPLNSRYARELTGRESWPQHIEKLTGDTAGVFYQFGENPVKLRASEAACVACERFADAILSIIPGRKAVLFNHETQVWFCSR